MKRTCGYQPRLRAGTDAADSRVDRLGESGIDEFDRLARELNLLGAEIQQADVRRCGDLVLREDPRTALLLEQSRAFALLGHTAAGVAHELRNQVQTVQFDLDALRRADDLPREEVKQRAHSAAAGLDRLGGVIRGFLKIARVRALTPGNVQVNDLVRELSEELRDEVLLSGADLSLELDAQLPETCADGEVLSQAIRNLVQNALHAFTRTGGHVTIRTGRIGETLQITVEDDGPGIPRNILEKVFDLYFTTRADGTGVGLTVVRQSVEMHGGGVRIKSQEGSGTQVTLDLPYRAPVIPMAG